MALEIDIKKRMGAFSLEMAFQAENETLGLLGESGCGKSVTLRSIAGIETPDEGLIKVNGRVFFDRAAGKKPRVNLSPQERKTALFFQNYMLFPNLTVQENVAAGIDKKIPAAEREKIVLKELRRFSLEGFEKRYPLQLSGGQQQRVALARMLAAQPGILMLDEPFSALDSHLKGVLEQNLVRLFDEFEGTILYVSHDIDEALRFCDRIAVVSNGRITETNAADELFNNPQSEAAIKLSGCKNIWKAEYLDDHAVKLPQWGLVVQTAAKVPNDVKFLGVRAFSIERAEGPGQNCYRVRVDRASDTRYDRTALVGFLGEDGRELSDYERGIIDEMRFLHDHVFWRIDKLAEHSGPLPEQGEETWIHIPEDKVYLASR